LNQIGAKYVNDLDRWRRAQGWSYSDLARAVGVTPQAARRYCTGDRIPQPEVMIRLKAVTNAVVTADSFIQAAAMKP
jgi:transcriptional regulator with XRE-family HTH domain